MKYLDYPSMYELTGQQTFRQLIDRHRPDAQDIFLKQKNGDPFWFNITPGLVALLTKVDELHGVLKLQKFPKFVSPSGPENTDGIKSESYYSSRIEGAVTSMDDAFRLMDTKQTSFADESQQMIQNNKRGIDFLWKNAAKKIDHPMILALHKLLVRNTHKDHPITVGAYRKGPIYVVNGRGEVIYEGPKFAVVPTMMDDYVKWVNQSNVGIHPLIKSIIAHFYFVHVHPFDDGNGRSTRALANLVLYQSGFEVAKMLAPSMYIDKHRSDYYRAIQDVRAHEGDLTYFLIYIAEAFVSEMKRLLGNDQKPATDIELNARQRKALAFAKKKNQALSTQIYIKLNACSDEMARRDFNQLVAAGLLVAQGDGRARKYVLK